MPNRPIFLFFDFSRSNRTCSIFAPSIGANRLAMQRSDWSRAMLIFSADKSWPVCHQKLTSLLVSRLKIVRQVVWQLCRFISADKNCSMCHRFKTPKPDIVPTIFTDVFCQSIILAYTLSLWAQLFMQQTSKGITLATNINVLQATHGFKNPIRISQTYGLTKKMKIEYDNDVTYAQLRALIDSSLYCSQVRIFRIIKPAGWFESTNTTRRLWW